MFELARAMEKMGKTQTHVQLTEMMSQVAAGMCLETLTIPLAEANFFNDRPKERNYYA